MRGVSASDIQSRMQDEKDKFELGKAVQQIGKTQGHDTEKDKI